MTITLVKQVEISVGRITTEPSVEEWWEKGEWETGELVLEE